MSKVDKSDKNYKNDDKARKEEDAKKNKPAAPIANEMSEEDKQLKETLELLVERLRDPDASLHKPALEALRTQIKSSAVSLTSVPKALKFLRHQFTSLVEIHEKHMQEDTNKRFLADILSIVAMTQSSRDENEEVPHRNDALKYRVVGQQGALGDWGHEYVRHLAMEIINEADGDQLSMAIVALAEEIATFFLDHNAEPDAVDLLYEVDRLALLPELCTAEGRDHERVCLYLMSCVPYEGDMDDVLFLETALAIYRRANDLPRSLLCALRLNRSETVREVFAESRHDPLLQRQLAYMLARQRFVLDTQDEVIQSILNNSLLSDALLSLGKELEILEPKTPEDIYKSHLQDAFRITATAPSPRQNLASAFVNGFSNAGFGTDKLLTSAEVEADDAKSWIYKTKDHGVVSTVASIGLLNLWNPDVGLNKLDRYLYSDNVQIKAGAILGIGLVHVGTKNEADPALALLREYLDGEMGANGDGTTEGDNPSANTVNNNGNNNYDSSSNSNSNNEMIVCSSLMGLALAYGGSWREDVVEAVLPFLGHENIKIAAMAALCVGHVFVGSCHGDHASAILQTLMERSPGPTQLDHPYARFLALSLALLYLGKTEAEAEVILDTLQVIDHPIGKDTAILVKICSYAGSGNVLKIQELLRICTNQQPNADGSPSEPTADGNGATFAAFGIALICMMEDIGKEMSHRLFSHLMHFGSPAVRKAVPLALALLYTSHPSMAVMDILSKYSHDHDKAVAINAIFGMGLIAAGSNNAKMAQMLRQLAAYYQRDVDCLYMVRIAQGLVHAAKGTATFSPIHSHRQLLSFPAVAGLLTTIVAFTDSQNLLIEGNSYLLYFLACAMYPRFVITLDESLQMKPVLMRVGQAVDVVGQAGKPKTITGFQTHNSPVLLAYQERAELATEELIPLTPILENFVIVKKNPNWVDEAKKK